MKVRSYTIDLSEQMAVCDANYIRLLKLLGNTRSINRRIFALPGLGKSQGTETDKTQIAVSLEVLEEFKYTSTICIKQERLAKGVTSIEKITALEAEPAHYNSPVMIIRVYHDAKTAEVTSFQNHTFFKTVYTVPNPHMYQRDEKEQLNLFLAEWLNLCINEGLSNPAELELEKLTCS
jgi:uncharacterized protein